MAESWLEYYIYICTGMYLDVVKWAAGTLYSTMHNISTQYTCVDACLYVDTYCTYFHIVVSSRTVSTLCTYLGSHCLL